MKLEDMVVKRGSSKSYKEGEFRHFEIVNILKRMSSCMGAPVDGGAPAHTEHEIRDVTDKLYDQWKNHSTKAFMNSATTEILRMGLDMKVHPPGKPRRKPQQNANYAANRVAHILNESMEKVGTRPSVIKFFETVIPAVLYKPNLSESHIRDVILDITTATFGQPKVKQKKPKPKPNSSPKKDTKPIEDVPRPAPDKMEFKEWKERMRDKLGKGSS